jgi:hypothetical protein
MVEPDDHIMKVIFHCLSSDGTEVLTPVSHLHQQCSTPIMLDGLWPGHAEPFAHNEHPACRKT